jgi:hypothetical protein
MTDTEEPHLPPIMAQQFQAHQLTIQLSQTTRRMMTEFTVVSAFQLLF